MRTLPLFCCLAGLLTATAAGAAGTPLEQRVDAGIRDCRSSDTLTVPLRSSGFDLVPLYGNGYELETDGGSPFDGKDLSVELRR
ncbi:hypothetical protein SB781_35795, partial [Paraburkholderia sp. SIMBA_061]